MIRVDNVQKYYGDFRALNRVSFEIQRGEIVGLLGPNGAGKTTMMRIITGYLPATEGDIFVDGNEVHAKPLAVKKLIGYMPENIAMYMEMTVEDYLHFCASLKHIPAREQTGKVEDAMKIVKITDRRRFLIGNLSKGYRQRVGLAQAILHDPEVLILDEPTVGLDPSQIVEIRSLIRSLAGTRTVVLSTHILSEVQNTCERAIIINKGNVIAENTIDGLKEMVEENIATKSVYVKLRDRVDDAVLDLRRMAGVTSVRKTEENVFFVEIEKEKDLRHEIARYLVRRRYELLELRATEIGLEDVFLHLTAEENENEGSVLS